MGWSLGWATDLMMRRLSGASISEGRGYVAVRTPSNPGYRRGNFLLLNHEPSSASIPGWVTLFRREVPSADQVVIGVDDDERESATDPFSGLGFSQECSVVLALDSSQAPDQFPDEVSGYAIRLLCGDADWNAALQLRRDVDQSPDEMFSRRRHEELRRICEDGHGAWFGAFRDGQMCSGLGIFSNGSGLGRFQHVQTHPEHRRRALARTLLLRASVHAFTVMAVSALVIVADPDNFAANIYRSVGFSDAGYQRLWQAPV